jgi:hypothetical protein
MTLKDSAPYQFDPSQASKAIIAFPLNISQFIGGINYGEADGHLTAHI